MFLDEPSAVSGQYGAVVKRFGNKIFKSSDKGSNIHDYQKAVSHFLSICHEANIVYEDR